MSSSESSLSASTARTVIPPVPVTEKRAWQVLCQYLAAHPLEPAATPTIPIGTPPDILPWIHAASMAGVNDATTFGNVALPSFPMRNLPDTQDDDTVLWQYYRSGHAYGITQQNEALRNQAPRQPEPKIMTIPQDPNWRPRKCSMATNQSSRVF